MAVKRPAAKAKKQEPVKRPVGRPTKYKPEFCELIRELAATGAGPAEWAMYCGVDKASLHEWRHHHPEFSTAFNEAKTIEQVWWERAGRESLRAEKFQASVWHKSMQARFRDDYTETQRTEITGAGGGAVQIETKKIDPRDLTQEQRDALMEIIKKASKD